MKFEYTFNKDQELKYIEFNKECYKELLDLQKLKYINTDKNQEYKRLTNNWSTPYTGAIGSLISITFTPTSLGTSIVLSCLTLNKELDITSYEDW